MHQFIINDGVKNKGLQTKLVTTGVNIGDMKVPYKKIKLNIECVNVVKRGNL